MKDLNVPIWHKATLTIDEAAAYSNIGRNQLRRQMLVICQSEHFTGKPESLRIWIK